MTRVCGVNNTYVRTANGKHLCLLHSVCSQTTMQQSGAILDTYLGYWAKRDNLETFFTRRRKNASWVRNTSCIDNGFDVHRASIPSVVSSMCLVYWKFASWIRYSLRRGLESSVDRFHDAQPWSLSTPIPYWYLASSIGDIKGGQGIVLPSLWKLTQYGSKNVTRSKVIES